MFLQTERLTLRQFAAADEADLISLDSDPRVMRFLTGQPTPPEVTREQTLPRFLDYHRAYPDRGYWATIERSSGQFLGWLALEPPRGGGRDTAELGYRLRASAWGRGYATEGARALVRAGFTTLGLELIWAQTMAVNLASRRVMEKAGLRHVRTFYPEFDSPLPGTELGEVEYALGKDEWRGGEMAG